MISIDGVRYFLNILGLKIDDVGVFNSLDVLDCDDNVIGVLKKYRSSFLLNADTKYGQLYVDYSILNNVSFFNKDEYIGVVFFSIGDSLKGTYKLRFMDSVIVETYCQLEKRALGSNNFVININNNDCLFNYIYSHRGGRENFTLYENGKIIYCSASGTFNHFNRSFPFLSTVTISKTFDLDKKIKATSTITDGGVPIFNREKYYSYDNMLEDELDVLVITYPDILERIEYIGYLIGNELFGRVVSSCLTSMSNEAFVKLFGFSKYNTEQEFLKLNKKSS